MKKTIAPILCLLFSVGCQVVEQPDDYVSKLEKNAKLSYSCLVQGGVRFPSSEMGNLEGASWNAESIFLSPGLSREFLQVHSLGASTLASYEIWDGTFKHIVSDCTSISEEDGPCKTVKILAPSLEEYSIFTKGGRSVCAQTLSLLEFLGPGQEEVSGAIVEISWPSINPEVNEELAFLLSYPGFSAGEKIERVTLSIDQTRGIPLSVAYQFQNGDSFRNEVTQFRFLNFRSAEDQEYILEEMLEPLSFSCAHEDGFGDQVGK